MFKSRFETFDQFFELTIENSYFLSFGDSPDDHAIILRFDTFDQTFQSFPFFRRFYFLGNRHFIGKRHQYQIPSCNTQFGSQAGSFGRNRFFGHLNGHPLSDCQNIGNFPIFGNFRFQFQLRYRHSFSSYTLFDIAIQRMKLGTQIQIM